MLKKDNKADLQRYSVEIFEKAVLLSLLLGLLSFLVMRNLPDIEIERTTKEKIVSFDIPPEVKQKVKLKAPPRPSIPLESESDDIPEDMTIAETVIDSIWTPPSQDDGFLDEDIEYIPMAQSNVKVLKKVEPVYPAKARDFEVEGIVVLKCFINSEGRVDRVQVLRSIEVLDQAAIDAVKKWRFEPAMQGGKPVAVQVNIPVTFRLRSR